MKAVETENCRPYEILPVRGLSAEGLSLSASGYAGNPGTVSDAHVSVAGNSITTCGSLKEKLKISGYGNTLGI